MTLGHARLTARVRIAGLESIQTARERARAKGPSFTFAQVYNDYLEQYVIRNRSAQSARTIAMNVLIPRWGTRPFDLITRADVVELVEEAKGRGSPNAARLQLGQVRMLYSWAISAGRYGIDNSPCDLINTQRLIAKPQHSRDRVLADAEIVALWKASGWLKYPFGDIYRLLLLTGQRVREVADAHWSEFDLNEGIWTIPQDRHKTSVNHVVMLPDEAIQLLKQLPRGTRGDVVFSWDGGRSAPKSNFNCAKRAIGHFMESALGGPVASPWVTHDIRRTVRTKLAEPPGE